MQAIFFGGAVLSCAVALSSIAREGAHVASITLLALAGCFVGGGYQLIVWNAARRTTIGDLRAAAESTKTQLSEQQRTVDELADGLDTAIFVCDAKANVLYANRRANELFRLDRYRGRTIVEVTLSFELEQLALKATREGGFDYAELTFSFPTEIFARAKAWRSSSTDDRVYLSIYEITDLRRLERVRRDFVANVSHELRTPLTLIRAMAETLQDDDDDKRRENYLAKIIHEVDRLSTISSDLLELSTAESNPVRKQRCDLAEIVRTVVEKLHHKAEEKGLALTFEGPESLPVEANPSQISQVAVNLIDNALNYTVEGSVAVRLWKSDGRGLLSVTDTGIGIASDHAPRVFERFYRVDKARSRQTGGTGLGLSIVKHIVEAHGGTVGVDSTLNVGSTFRVSLPIGD